jgi:rubrerythrin
MDVIDDVIELFKGHNRIKFILDGVGERECQTIEFKEFIEALEKQIPKKPKDVTYEPLKKHGWKYCCPVCNLAVGENNYDYENTQEDNFCPSCGQKLDWN